MGAPVVEASRELPAGPCLREVVQGTEGVPRLGRPRAALGGVAQVQPGGDAVGVADHEVTQALAGLDQGLGQGGRFEYGLLPGHAVHRLARLGERALQPADPFGELPGTRDGLGVLLLE
ncbi:hypothetical protein ACFQX6_55045 [Streptosporangium lutulentum]